MRPHGCIAMVSLLLSAFAAPLTAQGAAPMPTVEKGQETAVLAGGASGGSMRCTVA